jgi:hypothetical protein
MEVIHPYSHIWTTRRYFTEDGTNDENGSESWRIVALVLAVLIIRGLLASVLIACTKEPSQTWSVGAEETREAELANYNN